MLPKLAIGDVEVEKIAEEGVFPKRSWRYSENRTPIFRSPFDKTIVEAARHFDVDAALVSAVIKAESDYNPRIVSNKGARGLMQLMPATARGLAKGAGGIVAFIEVNELDPKAPEWVLPKHTDVVFLALHGTYGEDGTLQGLLEMADIPYAGCGVTASAVWFDKVAMKAAFVAAWLPGTEGRGRKAQGEQGYDDNRHHGDSFQSRLVS